MNLTILQPLLPVLVMGALYLVLYSLSVMFLFSPNKNGLRRRWMALDWVWVPLGGLTGVCLLALWWRMH